MYAYRRHYWIVLIVLVLTMAVWPVGAQQADAEQTVERFYTWYLDNLGYDAVADTFRNPIVDGSFRESPELSESLIAEIEAQDAHHHDPFLCAQDVPQSAAFSAFDEQTVLVSLYYGFNPHPHTVSVALNEDGLITAINCREALTASGTVETFYMEYILNRDDVLIGDHPLLTDALNAQLAETLGSAIPTGDGDPVVCAQDRPTYVQVDTVSLTEDTATMLVRTFFANNRTPHLLAIDLVRNERWKLDTITCDVPPEIVAAYVYNEFATYKRYDLEQGLERIPLDNWARYPWDTLLSDDLYDALMAFYLSDEPLMADPFLCSQDVPEHIRTVGGGDDVRVSGLFQSGENSYAVHNLARLTMAQTATGIWQITAITCIP